MNETNLKKFLKALSVTNVVRRDDWLNFHCVLAPATHEHGEDTKASAGVLINDDGPSYYYCFGCCDKPVRLEDLLFIYGINLKHYPQRAALICMGSEVAGSEKYEAPILPAEKMWTRKTEDPADPLPSDVLSFAPRITEDHPSRRYRAYFRSRGIRVWEDYGVRYFSRYTALAFPYTSHCGSIFALRLRLIEDKEFFFLTNKMIGWPDPFPKIKRTGVWFGLHLVDWKKPVWIVESETDVLRLASLGQRNVIASGGTSICDSQLEALTGSVYYLAMDSDAPGEKAMRKIARKLREKGRLYSLDWSLVDCKDAGDLRSRKELELVRSKAQVYGH